ncbi:hypothetical protein WS96_19975 [Burkholderia sp. MSMB1835]|nr:hypothetical protein WS96_19975 [Burkholderia sp. MSMB1835]
MPVRARHRRDALWQAVRDEWIASVSGWTPYDGCAVTGWPVHTVVRGQVVVRDGELHGRPAGKAVTFLDT